MYPLICVVYTEKSSFSDKGYPLLLLFLCYQFSDYLYCKWNNMKLNIVLFAGQRLMTVACALLMSVTRILRMRTRRD